MNGYRKTTPSYLPKRCDPFSRKIPIRSAGFTVVELMIGLAIAAIVASTAVPQFMDWKDNRRQKGHAMHLYSSMQSAKMTAIRDSCDVVVSFTPPNSYEIFLDNGGSTGLGISNQVRNDDEKIVTTGTISGDVALSIEASQFDSTNVCGFTSRGLPLLGRSGNVVVRKQGGNTDIWYRVVLSPAGLISLQGSNNSTDGTDGDWY